MKKMGGLLVLVLACGASPISDEERFRPGTTIKIYQSHENARTPAFSSLVEYRDFLRAMKAKSTALLSRLNGNTIRTLRNGRTLKIVSYLNDKNFHIRAPVIEAQIEDGDGTGEVCWIAAQYLRPSDQALIPGEIPLPLLASERNSRHIPEPGETLTLWNETESGMNVCFGMNAYDEYIKAMTAKDSKGLSILVRNGSIKRVECWTKILILERHENQFIGKGTAVVEGRILDGPLKDEVVWVSEINTAQFNVVFARSGRREAKTNQTDTRVASLLRQAQALEKSKKPAAALIYYRQVVKEHPDSLEAKVATERIGVLDKKK